MTLFPRRSPRPAARRAAPTGVSPNPILGHNKFRLLAPWLAFAAICLVWGSTFLALRIAVETLPPFAMIAMRCVVAGAILGGVAAAQGARLPRGAALASAAVSGVLMFTFSQAALAWAEQRLASGPAAVLSCTVSLMMPAIAWGIGAAPRPGRRATIGLLVGFLGVVLLARPAAAEGGLLPRAVALGAALAWALGAALARKIRPGNSVMMGSGLQLFAGGAGCILVALARGEPAMMHAASVSARSVVALLYLVSAGSLLAFGCFSWLVQIWPPERLAPYAFINPVVALLLGAALAGEPIGMREVLASGLILAAVALTLRPARAAAALAEAEAVP